MRASLTSGAPTSHLLTTHLRAGADVSHSGAVSYPKPSIAAVVSNLDPSCGIFISSIRAQGLVEPAEGSTRNQARKQEVGGIFVA